ncbi:MAG: erv26 super protein [Bathelium mastoideum]|nr:MAG: erv26 super protein [Bathelium mastoideum]
MWILPLLGYLGVILGFAFLTLAIASGLYYLSELVEEHTVIAKKVLTYLIYSVVSVQILLVVVDRFPFGLTAVGVASHGVYSLNLRRFPIVKLTDPTFILSCVLVLLNHYLWFRHFSSPPSPPSSRYSSPSSTSYSNSIYGPDELPPTFTDVASYFGLCVWLVPFALFVSLSAGENVLPSMGSEYATGEGSSFVSAGKEPGSGKVGREGMAKAVVNGVREWVGETGEVMGFWKGERTRKTF